MPTVLGSSSSDSVKTLTLRQYFKQQNGNVPKISAVKIIFKPGKFACYTFITEHDFKVSVSEDSPLFGVLVKEMEDWVDDCRFIAIQPNDAEKGSFDLVALDGEQMGWEEFAWGFKLQAMDKKRSRSSRNKTRSTVSDADIML